jgi:hypothetical protein
MSDASENKPVTWKYLRQLLFEVGVATRQAITTHAVEPLGARIAALEKELAETKAAKPNFADSYIGVWQPGLHERGCCATWEGSLWICRVDTTAKPGANGDWQMLVKRGKDGKDLRA